MNTKTKALEMDANKPSRRKFFIGAGAAVGAVATQTSVGKAVIQEIGSTVKAKEEGQQITAHMRKYYETTLL